MKKTTKKSSSKKAKKAMKVIIEQPVVKAAPETYKEPPVVEKPKELPVDPPKKEVANPNDPKIVGRNKGYKEPSITNTKQVFTRKQFDVLVEEYKKQNPVKAAAKKSELDAKRKAIK